MFRLPKKNSNKDDKIHVFIPKWNCLSSFIKLLVLSATECEVWTCEFTKALFTWRSSNAIWLRFERGLWLWHRNPWFDCSLGFQTAYFLLVPLSWFPSTVKGAHLSSSQSSGWTSPHVLHLLHLPTTRRNSCLAGINTTCYEINCISASIWDTAFIVSLFDR